MTSVVLAVNAVFFHGNPGFYDDSIHLRNSLGSNYNWVDGDQLQNQTNVDLAVSYSYGAYTLLKAIEEQRLNAKTVVLIAPFIKSDKALSFMALTILRIPFLRSLIVARSWTKWKDELVDKMFSKQELDSHSVDDYLKKIDNESVWHNVILAKLKQDRFPVSVLSTAPEKILIIVGGADLSTPPKKVEQDLCDLALKNTQTHEILHASHGIIFSHYKQIAQKIKEFMHD